MQKKYQKYQNKVTMSAQTKDMLSLELTKKELPKGRAISQVKKVWTEKFPFHTERGRVNSKEKCHFIAFKLLV